VKPVKLKDSPVVATQETMVVFRDSAVAGAVAKTSLTGIFQEHGLERRSP
jgi:hypothetical protein